MRVSSFLTTTQKRKAHRQLRYMADKWGITWPKIAKSSGYPKTSKEGCYCRDLVHRADNTYSKENENKEVCTCFIVTNETKFVRNYGCGLTEKIA
jgi:hypothetical protein